MIRTNRNSRRLQDEEVEEVLRLFDKGLGSTKISEETHISVSSITDILKGRTYKEITGGKDRCQHGRSKRPKSQLAIYSPRVAKKLEETEGVVINAN